MLLLNTSSVFFSLPLFPSSSTTSSEPRKCGLFSNGIRDGNRECVFFCFGMWNILTWFVSHFFTSPLPSMDKTSIVQLVNVFIHWLLPALVSKDKTHSCQSCNWLRKSEIVNWYVCNWSVLSYPNSCRIFSIKTCIFWFTKHFGRFEVTTNSDFRTIDDVLPMMGLHDQFRHL